jgi:hypothetical protein
MAPSGSAAAHGKRLGAVWPRRWRWYRSRLGAGVVVTALGCVVFVSAVVTSGSEWHEKLSPPLESVDLARSSVAQVSPDLPAVVLGQDPPPRWGDNVAVDRAHETVVTDHTGRPLVDERLIQYRDERKAETQVLEWIVTNTGSARRDSDRFFSIEVGCPDACRHAKVARKGSVVILLAGREAGTAPEAEQIEAALVKVANRYAQTSPPDIGPVDESPYNNAPALVVALWMLVLFLPFVVWHAWCTRHSQRTPHHHDGSRTEAGVIDCCATARRWRLRGHVFLGLRLGVFLVTAMLVWVQPLLIFAAVPLCWLIALPFTRRKRATGLVHPRPALLRRDWNPWLLLRSLAVLTLAVAVAGLAWLSGAIAIGLFAPAIIGIAWEEMPSGVLQLSSFADVIDVVAILFLLFGILAGVSVLNRLRRRTWPLAVGSVSQSRPLVLYLRSFADDRRVVAASGVTHRPAQEVFSFRARIPYEEVIARELGRHGNVAAIAEPVSPPIFLPLGASRMRLSSSDWRSIVRARMHDAALVVIAIGSTEGLSWEIETATRDRLLDRVLLLVPPDEEETLRLRWRATADAIRASGGPIVDSPVDPAAILVAQLSADGLRRLVVADRRDEHTYAVAVDAAVAAFADESHQRTPTSSVSRPESYGAPRS